ncbi:hypothetical protein DXG01_014314 [Tephrocybe rancida]|nr:hypothetical protein DXG01_014314 [Tephrocybe rancida]
MATIYDSKISEGEIDRFADIVETAVTKISESFFPGAVAVNALPFLRHLPTWFPGAGFHKFAAECKVCTDEMQNYPFRHVQEKMAAGDEVSGLLARLLQRKADNSEWAHEEADIKCVTATSFVGGTDTTVSAVETFLYAMVVSYEAQKKAQDEIDRVVGNKRLPDFSDRESMPYLEAVFREVMRWHPVTPLGISHATSEDDIYKGYFIPKGTTVMPNIWAMTHDEMRYPQPDSFLPERFFDEDGKLNDDDTVLSFGFGRRICPGRHMASSTVWLLISTILATFDIRKVKDEQGNEIPVDASYSDGSQTSIPLLYYATFTGSPEADPGRQRQLTGQVTVVLKYSSEMYYTENNINAFRMLTDKVKRRLIKGGDQGPAHNEWAFHVAVRVKKAAKRGLTQRLRQYVGMGDSDSSDEEKDVEGGERLSSVKRVEDATLRGDGAVEQDFGTQGQSVSFPSTSLREAVVVMPRSGTRPWIMRSR